MERFVINIGGRELGRVGLWENYLMNWGILEMFMCYEFSDVIRVILV